VEIMGVVGVNNGADLFVQCFSLPFIRNKLFPINNRLIGRYL
jgi:hypothetical protein